MGFRFGVGVVMPEMLLWVFACLPVCVICWICGFVILIDFGWVLRFYLFDGFSLIWLFWVLLFGYFGFCGFVVFGFRCFPVLFNCCSFWF